MVKGGPTATTGRIRLRGERFPVGSKPRFFVGFSSWCDAQKVDDVLLISYVSDEGHRLSFPPAIFALAPTNGRFWAFRGGHMVDVWLLAAEDFATILSFALEAVILDGVFPTFE